MHHVAGIGVVLSHVRNDGTARPAACGSRSLRKAKHNYSHIEGEA